jgi:hypothetical protein
METSVEQPTVNYKTNLKYFKKRKLKWQILLLIIGVVFIAIPAERALGVPLVIIAVALIVWKFVRGPSDKFIDQQMKLKVDNIRQIAQAALMLDDDQIRMVDPLEFSGYRFQGPNLVVKRGRDKKMRSTLGQAIVFFFADNIVGTFRYTFSLVDPTEDRSSNRFSYQDVISHEVSSSTSNVDKDTSMAMETLTIETNKQKVWITLPQSDEVVRAMRGASQLIDEKKASR